jgi:hypothetical protein
MGVGIGERHVGACDVREDLLHLAEERREVRREPVGVPEAREAEVRRARGFGGRAVG